MQSYILNINRKPKIHQVFNSLKNKQINDYSLNSDDIRLKFKINQDIYNIIIYLESNLKPNFVLVESETDQENLYLNSMIENLNSYIDSFENLNYLIYEIKKVIDNFILIKDTPVPIIKIKDIQLFKDNLEKIKNSYIERKDNDTSNNGVQLFSYRSMIEMLGDQILKIELDDRFNIDLEDFSNLENIIIKVNGFTFKGSEKLEVKILMNVNLNWIKYPPSLALKSNMILSDNILSVIEKLKPFSDTKSWSIKYSIYDTIVNIYKMINTYGEIQYDNPNNIEIIIIELEHLFSLKDKQISSTKLLELFDKNLVQNCQNNNLNKSQYQKEYWKKGTGYGHEQNAGTQWDIEEYVNNINNKKKNINIKFKNFINLLESEQKIIYDYKEKITQLLEQYINFDEQDSNNLIKIANIIHSNNKVFDSQDKTTVKIIKHLKDYFEENNIDHPMTKESKVELIIKNMVYEKLDEYQKQLYEYKFKFIDSGYKNFYYDSNHNSGYNSGNLVKSTNINSGQITRLQKEFIILKKSITIDKDASIFFTVDKSNIYKMRFIISGPKDTPYSYGLFIFDMSFTTEFPQKPPLVHFVNHGNKRFNPNLYDCGKVCLSLLGTWNTSNKGETWNSSISTFNQIIISIQSLILIDEPYFNEPGHEKSIGTPNGIEKSKNYNNTIKKYTIDHTINDLIEDIVLNKEKYKEFENVIKNHFKFHSENIKKQNESWYNHLPDNQKNSFKQSMDKFDNYINKL